VILKSEVEGSPTVTVSAAVPLSSTEKVFDSLAAVLPKIIFLKVRLDGLTLSSLNGVGFALGWTTWAEAESAIPMSRISTKSPAIVLLSEISVLLPRNDF
jgi:hypothetical protein